MKTSTIVILAVLGSFAFTGIGCTMSLLSQRTKCIAAESGIQAQHENMKNVFDNTWKSIREMAQVPDQYVKAMKGLMEEAVKGRTGASGELVRAIHEANPTLDSTMFVKIQQRIEAGHAQFMSEQTALLDRKREYENVLGSLSTNFLNWFVSPAFPRIKLDDYKIVTSDQTEKAFSTGKTGELNVFGPATN